MADLNRWADEDDTVDLTALRKTALKAAATSRAVDQAAAWAVAAADRAAAWAIVAAADADAAEREAQRADIIRTFGGTP
jgi:hypothetical protein